MGKLHRHGCLQDGWNGIWQWTRDGVQIASVQLRTARGRLHLTYRVKSHSGEWEDMTEIVTITHVPCRYGGTRPYLACPGVVNDVACDQRVSKLYGGGRYFLCRHCYRLTHASQGEDAANRALRRARRLRQQLGASPDLGAPFPPRLKGRWRRTHERLLGQALEAELRAEDIWIEGVDRLLAQIDASARERSFWQ